VESLEEAEVVKLINNSYRDTIFGFANEVALACRAFGIDANRVINAANTGYPRSNVPRPSPGVGGYCLEKDPHIFIASAKAHGEELHITRKGRETNERIILAVADDIASHLRKYFPKVKSPRIFIMGMAFKGRPATSDLRGSPSLALVDALRKRGYKNILRCSCPRRGHRGAGHRRDKDHHVRDEGRTRRCHHEQPRGVRALESGADIG